MIDQDKLMDLAKIFDSPSVKVVGVMPKNIRLSEIVGIQNYPDKTTKISFNRGAKLYLCWIETASVISDILRLKEEIKNNNDDPEERYEAWEIYGSQEPRKLITSLLRSRLRNEDERRRYWEVV